MPLRDSNISAVHPAVAGIPRPRPIQQALSTVRSVGFPNPDDYVRDDNVRGNVGRYFAANLRQTESSVADSLL